MAEELKLSVKVGTREVVASGSVVTKVSEHVIITLGSITYRVEFHSTDDKALTASAKIASPNTLAIQLNNFDNPLGTSYSAAVGELNGKRLELDLFVFAIGEPNKQRLVNYTFSYEKEGSRG